jgi:hypothetical protein|uniref:Uncharacterized protein n=1 Tax=Siphoviridae sp. ctQ091 TaxID=2825490 RepID=A0A8S5NTG5_9CAUD|nr:MAG TPA: hypothetical protein [Siphoviridae sp. ctQ091]
MGAVFETVVTQAVREWNEDGRRHEFNVHVPARRIYDGGIVIIGSTCRIVVAGNTVRARSIKRKSVAISVESVGEFVRRALIVAANRSKAAGNE